MTRITSLLLLSFSIWLSLWQTLDSKNNSKYVANDFSPTTGIKPLHNKILWYISQITYQTQFMLWLYFMLQIFSLEPNGSEIALNIFHIFAPICITVNVQYFLLLFPKMKNKNGIPMKLYDLSFSSIIPHLLDTFLILMELYNINSYDWNDTLQHLVFLPPTIVIVLFNYIIRGVWSYDLIKLNELRGWKLVGSTVVMNQIFSLILKLAQTIMHGIR